MDADSHPVLVNTVGDVTPSSNDVTSNSVTSTPPELLTKITSTVYYHTPQTKPIPTSPSAILLFAWMGAPIRHMTKFAEYYSQTLFPGTPIIVILNPANSFFAGDQKRKAILPAVTAYQALGITSSNVLVHIFSNGGLNAFRTFVELTPEKMFTPPLLILDSAPGRQTLVSALKAFTADFRNPVAKLVVSVLLTMVFGYMWFMDLIFRREPMLDGLRRWLNDEKAIGKETRRLYLYSDKVEMVQSEDVQMHVQQATDRGYLVKARNFGASPHVGHMRANPEMYWEEIAKAWKEKMPT